MTSRPVPRKPSAPTGEQFISPPRIPFDPGDGKFPVFPPRGDMQNPIHLHRPSHLAALSVHFGSPETTLVLGEVPVGRDLRQRRGLRVPDLIIAFGVNPAKIIADRGYSIEEWDKPPDFVLEVASETTSRNDLREKSDDYAAFGIREYWRFDPTGGEYYGTGLAGDRLVDGVYQPISIVMMDETHYWGASEVLGLHPCWEERRLRWYDPATRRYLLTYNEMAEEHIAALDERDAAQARIRELEAEIRRLRD